MRWAVLLLFAQGAGILWADRGGVGLAPIVGPVALCGAFVVLAMVVSIAIAIASRAADRRAVDAVAATAVVLLGLAAGEAGLSRALATARAGADLAESVAAGAIHRVDARVAARRPTSFGDEVELVEVRARAGEPAVPERLLLTVDSEHALGRRSDRLLWPGAAVRLGLRIAPLHPSRNPGTPDRAHSVARRGFGARARLVKPDWVSPRPERARLASGFLLLAQLRQRAVDRLAARLGERPGSGLVRALALGDRRGISRATRDAFRTFGLAHLLSVSGLHIGFVALPVASAIAWLRLRVRRRASPVLGFAGPAVGGGLAALGYAWLTGGSTPALRASLVFALLAATGLLGRTPRPAVALVWIAIVLLGFEPANLFDLGAQLSFGACWALIAAGIWRAPSPARSPRAAVRAVAMPWLVEPIAASLAVSLVLLPLVEANGLPRAWASPLVNALAIPWTGFVVMPCALLAAALSMAPEAAFVDGILGGLLMPAAALDQASIAGHQIVLRHGLAAEAAGRLPWAVGLFFIAGGVVALRFRCPVGAAFAWLVVGGLGLAPLEAVDFAAERPRVVFFDVGQADAALVETADSAWLIDTGSGPPDGSGGATLVRSLRSLGVRRLEVVVVTHADLDHRGGAQRVLDAFPVRELWLPATPADDPAFASLRRHARARGTRVRGVAAGDRRGTPGGFVVDVLWPLRAAGQLAPARARRNDQSIVLAVELGKRRMLFMGDVGANVESQLLTRGRIPDVDVLKLGHHGSRASSSAALVMAASPDWAIVSAPCDSARGLPNRQTLDRLALARARLAWTGRDGAVALRWPRSVEAPLEVERWGRPRRCLAAGPSRDALDSPAP